MKTTHRLHEKYVRRAPAALAPMLLLTLMALTLATAWPSSLAGQERVDETRSLQPDARLSLRAVAHDVRVETWDRNEVHLTGTIDSDHQELEISGDERALNIRIRHERNTRSEFSGSLQLRVPRGVRLSVQVVSGELELEGLTGEVQAHTVSGDLLLSGSPSRAELHSVSGEVRVTGAVGEMDLHTVSGSVEARDVGGRIEAHSVSGGIEIEAGSTLERVRAQSVSGHVDLSGGLSSSSDVEVQSHSGQVRLRLPAAAGARYEVETHSGSISNRLTSDEPRSPRYGPGRDLNFTVGDGSARVRVNSFSGSVILEPGG